MNSNYEIVRYESGLRSQVIDLQSHLWSPSPALNSAYFEWKYERNPYVDTPLIYLALQNGRAVGMRGFMGMQWESGIPSHKSTELYADDLVIGPEHRNRGLIPKIMAAAFGDLAKREYRYALNLSAGPITLLSSLATGWRSVGPLQQMQRRSWRAALSDGRERLIGRLVKPSRGIRAISRKQPEGKMRTSFMDFGPERARIALKSVPWILFEEAPRSTDMSELVVRIGDSGRIRQVRDSKYFDWRFQNPLSRYRFLYWLKPQFEGYLVLQEYTSPYADKAVVNIVDWEATNRDVQAELFQAAIDLASNRKLIVWSANLHRQTMELLEDKGFELEPIPQSARDQPHSLLVRPIRKDGLDGDWVYAGQRLLDMKSWDIRMLFSMHG